MLASFVFTVKAQLLVSDCAFASFDHEIPVNLSKVDSSYHDANNCRLAYTYTKVAALGGQQLTSNTSMTYDYFPGGNRKQTVTQRCNPGIKTYVNLSRTTLAYYQFTPKTLTSLNETWVNKLI